MRWLEAVPMFYKKYKMYVYDQAEQRTQNMLLLSLVPQPTLEDRLSKFLRRAVS